jgi:hypothetical protein
MLGICTASKLVKTTAVILIVVGATVTGERVSGQEATPIPAASATPFLTTSTDEATDPASQEGQQQVEDRTHYYTALMQASATMAALLGGFLLTFGTAHARSVQRSLRRYETVNTEIHNLIAEGKRYGRIMERLDDRYDERLAELEAKEKSPFLRFRRRFRQPDRDELLLRAAQDVSAQETLDELNAINEQLRQDATRLEIDNQNVTRDLAETVIPNRVLGLAAVIIGIILVTGMIAPMFVLFIGQENVGDGIEALLFGLAVVGLIITVALFAFISGSQGWFSLTMRPFKDTELAAPGSSESKSAESAEPRYEVIWPWNRE